MFGKKCLNCNRKISKAYEFCPHCGKIANEKYKKEEFGLLGKDDFIESNFKIPSGFNMLFNSLFKELDKQFKELDKTENDNIKRFKRSGVSINITSIGNKVPEIKIKSFGGVPIFNDQKLVKQTPISQIRSQKISSENVKRLSSLPREEANATVRRLSNKIIYEIDVPGVKSLKDIIINELENSIEVKAIGKNKAYSKLIPVNLPLKRYSLKDEKLVLELDVSE